MTVRNPVHALRSRVGHQVFLKIAGPDGDAARLRVHDTPGPRWFPPGSPIRRVHADVTTFVGGLRALLLQSLHPLAMAGVAGHSGYRGDPWGRLARTSTFLAFTTFGAESDALRMVQMVRDTHEKVRGTAPDGREYDAGDPHLLTWVHIAEADSFLAAHQRYGERPLTPEQADEYVAQSGEVARRLGAVDVPTTTAELATALDAYRPELHATAAALDTARFLLREPPLPQVARPPYALLASGAVALLPAWARSELDLDRWTTRSFGPTAGALATHGIRWLMGSADRRASTVDDQSSARDLDETSSR
ncbi:oxygenase MpaB family protein [Demequina capsici]|uniref:Oxygenase MpaB family protein n=1 Tax=Demequina capsici TaxID=3075620 RepID=A0AA96FEG6_9MICO|nr:oxygenase MpaB family protein [Demequina sp. PMTSA13]WNM28508.1 oxygenase MpaB family protein [Demequina sp. PMTSA13]